MSADDSTIETARRGLVIPVPETGLVEPQTTSHEWAEPVALKDREGTAQPSNFDIDDTLRSRSVIRVTDGSRLVIGFEAFIDWSTGTTVNIKLTSYTIREKPGNRIYRLTTTFRLKLETKKLGKTIPPMEISPMEDAWPSYGLNFHGGHLNWAEYAPGQPFSAPANAIRLPFSGARLVRGTGEPRDNKLYKVTIRALGGFEGQRLYASETKSAIRGGK